MGDDVSHGKAEVGEQAAHEADHAEAGLSATRVTFTLISDSLKIKGAAAGYATVEEALASATLASQTPSRMGRVARATRHGTAAPMQAETRSCSRVMQYGTTWRPRRHIRPHTSCMTT